MIVYETKMEKIPENCMACKMDWCPLPVGRGDKVKAKYLKRRHPDCPLKNLDHLQDK